MSAVVEVAVAPPAAELGWVGCLLRDRPALVAHIRTGEDLSGLARAMVVTILLGGGAFGAALGAYRGGWQILFAALKLPLVLLLTACVCAPVLTALRRAVVGAGALRRDLALVLSTLALASLVQLACVPLFVLAKGGGADYHELIVLAVAIYGVSGMVGLLVLREGQKPLRGRGGWLVTVGTLMVFLTVAAQMAWVLRPYLVRPRTEQPPLVRELEGDFFEAAVTSAYSALGIYSVDAYEDRGDW